jgi:hypothetical protein
MDSSIDLAAVIADRINLEHHWVTYSGLFTSGSDVSVHKSFDPGPRLPVVPGMGALKSELTFRDAAVLGMIHAVDGLSTAAQPRHLTLPSNLAPN